VRALLAGDWLVTGAFSKLSAVMGSWRGWLAADWPSTGGVLNITAVARTAGFHYGGVLATQRERKMLAIASTCLYSLYA